MGVVVGDVAAERARRPLAIFSAGDSRVSPTAGLVADAEEEDLRALDRLAGVVEGALDPLHAEGRLGLVDLAGQLDELGVEVVLARLEGEVEGVDREAVAAHARPGVEAHEAEGLGRGGVDHLPDVDAEPVAELASSLTRAMLTERKMFSSSFESSAASGLERTTTSSQISA